MRDTILAIVGTVFASTGFRQMASASSVLYLFSV